MFATGMCRSAGSPAETPVLHPQARPATPVYSPSPTEFVRDIGQLSRAVNDLRRRAPDLSAATPLRAWQQAVLFVAVALLVAGIIMLDGPGLALWAFVLSLPFLAITAIRIAALWRVVSRAARKDRRRRVVERTFDHLLPSISVLVAIYREKDIVPELVSALARLDYPEDRVEFLFVTEASDATTREALLRASLAQNMRIVTVPRGFPQTKPRALNYALQEARGTLVGIFDAEDVPDRLQLRRAAEAFVEGGPKLACVQARLAIYNADESFLTRQFALEYSALFEGLLPALDYFRLPLPLGGTSNYFRRDVLLKVGGWDPFNVTEDADLGIRLSRFGYDVSTIDSETQEEAPRSWRAWRGQRTRWIKGYIQTYLVHTRRPVRLWRDLGAWKFFGLQAVVGGMVLSMLVHPWFYVIVLLHSSLGLRISPENDLLWWICGFNLAAGYGSASLLAAATALRSGMPGRLVSVVWLPIYWLGISFAAYCAVFDLIKRPHHWEKTEHGASAHASPLRSGAKTSNQCGKPSGLRKERQKSR